MLIDLKLINMNPLWDSVTFWVESYSLNPRDFNLSASLSREKVTGSVLKFRVLLR